MHVAARVRDAVAELGVLERDAEDLGDEYYAKKFASNDLPMSPVAATGGNWWSEVPDGQKCFWFAAILLMILALLAAR